MGRTMRKTSSDVKRQIGILGRRIAELKAVGGDRAPTLSAVLCHLAQEESGC